MKWGIFYFIFFLPSTAGRLISILRCETQSAHAHIAHTVDGSFRVCARLCAHIIFSKHKPIKHMGPQMTHTHKQTNSTLSHTPLPPAAPLPAHLPQSRGSAHDNMLQLAFMGSTRLLFNYCWNPSFVCSGVIYQTNEHICAVTPMMTNNFNHRLMSCCCCCCCNITRVVFS